MTLASTKAGSSLPLGHTFICWWNLSLWTLILRHGAKPQLFSMAPSILKLLLNWGCPFTKSHSWLLIVLNLIKLSLTSPCLQKQSYPGNSYTLSTLAASTRYSLDSFSSQLPWTDLEEILPYLQSSIVLVFSKSQLLLQLQLTSISTVLILVVLNSNIKQTRPIKSFKVPSETS